MELPAHKIPAFINNMSLLKKVKGTVIVDCRELCCKKIDLVHKRNHHVVVDFEDCQSAEYILTLSNVNDDRILSNGDLSGRKFRVCIVDNNLNIVYHSTDKHIRDCESFKVILEDQCEYKIYISCIADGQDKQ